MQGDAHFETLSLSKNPPTSGGAGNVCFPPARRPLPACRRVRSPVVASPLDLGVVRARRPPHKLRARFRDVMRAVAGPVVSSKGWGGRKRFRIGSAPSAKVRVVQKEEEFEVTNMVHITWFWTWEGVTCPCVVLRTAATRAFGDLREREARRPRPKSMKNLLSDTGSSFSSFSAKKEGDPHRAGGAPPASRISCASTACPSSRTCARRPSPPPR